MGLGYGVMVTQQVLVLFFLVRIRVSQPKKGGSLQGEPPFLYAQHEYQLTGASPERALIAGIVQPKARVSIARWNLKEAGGKHLA